MYEYTKTNYQKLESAIYLKNLLSKYFMCILIICNAKSTKYESIFFTKYFYNL